MSTINVDIVDPQSGNNVTVSGVSIDAPNTTSVSIGNNSNASTVAINNTAIGRESLKSITTGTSNTAVGRSSLRLLTTGTENASVGISAMSNLTVGTENTALGSSAGGGLTTGNQNTFLGRQSGQHTQASNYNVCVGFQAGFGIDPLGLPYAGMGDYNTCVGSKSGYQLTNGTNNTLIGYEAGLTYTTGTNNICLGLGAIGTSLTASNEITLGNSSNAVLRCAVTSITSLSDERDKKDIKDLSTGLEFVEALRPVEFTWNDRDENGKHDIADFGFIAQDLKKAQEDAEKAEVLKLVYEENPEKLEASYGKLIPILVKAIQELSEEVKQLKNK
jgi:hypothetical protein